MAGLNFFDKMFDFNHGGKLSAIESAKMGYGGSYYG